MARLQKQLGFQEYDPSSLRFRTPSLEMFRQAFIEQSLSGFNVSESIYENFRLADFFSDQERLSRQAVKQQYGIDLPIGINDTTRAGADFYYQRKLDRRYAQDRLQTAEPSFFNSTVALAGGLLGGINDPITLGAGALTEGLLLPRVLAGSVGATKTSSLALSLATKPILREGVYGSLGAALLQPAISANLTTRGEQFSEIDVISDIVLNGVFGAGTAFAQGLVGSGLKRLFGKKGEARVAQALSSTGADDAKGTHDPIQSVQKVAQDIVNEAPAPDEMVRIVEEGRLQDSETLFRGWVDDDEYTILFKSDQKGVDAIASKFDSIVSSARTVDGIDALPLPDSVKLRLKADRIEAASQDLALISTALPDEVLAAPAFEKVVDALESGENIVAALQDFLKENNLTVRLLDNEPQVKAVEDNFNTLIQQRQSLEGSVRKKKAQVQKQYKDRRVGVPAIRRNEAKLRNLESDLASIDAQIAAIGGPDPIRTLDDVVRLGAKNTAQFLQDNPKFGASLSIQKARRRLMTMLGGRISNLKEFVLNTDPFTGQFLDPADANQQYMPQVMKEFQASNNQNFQQFLSDELQRLDRQVALSKDLEFLSEPQLKFLDTLDKELSEINSLNSDMTKVFDEAIRCVYNSSTGEV